MAETKRILVIDDDVDIREFCRIVLESAGYDVLLASGATEGLALVKSEHPDLAVLDIMMEESDSGFQLAATLGQEAAQLPIIMLSSIADAAHQVFDTTLLPVKELVNKPISAEDLLAKVAKLLK